MLQKAVNMQGTLRKFLMIAGARVLGSAGIGMLEADVVRLILPVKAD